MNQSRLIFHVDDDPDDRLLLSETIPDGYKLHSLESGKALLDHLATCPAQAMPILILLDINMPEMDGWETLRQLRNYDYSSNIKVVMFTTASAMTLEADKERFQVAVLTKPFNYSGLHECWQKVLAYAAKPIGQQGCQNW